MCTRFKFEWSFCGTHENHSPSASLEIDANGHWVFEDPRGQTFEATFVAPDRAEGRVISVERMLPSCPRTEATFTAIPVSQPGKHGGGKSWDRSPPLRHRLAATGGKEHPDRHGARQPRRDLPHLPLRQPRRRLRNEPGYSAHGPDNSLPGPGLTGGPLANTDTMFSTVPRRTDSKAQRRERRQILAAVRDTICLRQTGAPCPS